MTEPIELRTDGPHSPEYTKQVGNVLAESVRTLDHATRGDAPGLEYPADVYDLLGALYTATQRLPQLLGQVASFLEVQRRDSALADAFAGSVPGHALSAREAAGEAIGHLAEGADFAGDLTQVLQAAQNAISGLYVKEDNADAG